MKRGINDRRRTARHDPQPYVRIRWPVSVEPFHLFRYLDEQTFRYNNRATEDNPLNDSDRFSYAMSHIVGKRLTYAGLTGKVGETAF